MCVCENMHVCVLGGCVEVRGQLCGVCSLLLPSCGSRMEVRFSSLVVYALTVMPADWPWSSVCSIYITSCAISLAHVKLKLVF